eukprot:scaffold9648_cov144-Skeletonema_menzelii.AAC.5
MQANDEVFVYFGVRGERIPDEVKRVRIDKSCKLIPDRAFSGRLYLEEVRLHDGVKEIRYGAFYGCNNLRRINFPANLSVIGVLAFAFCKDLIDIEFPEGISVIGEEAFRQCKSLSVIKLPENLESIWQLYLFGAHYYPSKYPSAKTNHQVFDGCDRLNSIDITGVVHRVISSLTLKKWSDDINTELKRINSILPSIKRGPKTTRMMEWMERLDFKIEGYKLEHNRVLKEAMSLLELALWKAKLEEDGFTKKRKRRAISRVYCGASAVIENVCSYLTIFDVEKGQSSSSK